MESYQKDHVYHTHIHTHIHTHTYTLPLKHTYNCHMRALCSHMYVCYVCAYTIFYVVHIYLCSYPVFFRYSKTAKPIRLLKDFRRSLPSFFFDGEIWYIFYLLFLSARMFIFTHSKIEKLRIQMCII